MKTITLIILLCFIFYVSGNCEEPAAQFATWFSRESCLREGNSGITSSGKLLDDGAMWCALPFHPPKVNGKRQWGQKWKVTNLQTRRQIVLKHMDYGPGKKARARNVIIDLTPAAFLALGGNLRDGKIKVRVEKYE